jgi:hypothetical protein
MITCFLHQIRRDAVFNTTAKLQEEMEQHIMVRASCEHHFVLTGLGGQRMLTTIRVDNLFLSRSHEFPIKQ